MSADGRRAQGAANDSIIPHPTVARPLPQVLVDTPLAPYFSDNLTHEDLDEMNIEIMRNTLYKAYLDDFAEFCQALGSTTAEVMTDLLAFEVRRCAGGWGEGLEGLGRLEGWGA